jgi:hypothetical protein
MSINLKEKKVSIIVIAMVQAIEYLKMKKTLAYFGTQVSISQKKWFTYFYIALMALD